MFSIPTTKQGYLHRDGTAVDKIIRDNKELLDSVHNWIYVIDNMTYGSSALAKAAWVPSSDDVNDDGVTVTIDSTSKVHGASTVSFTNGDTTHTVPVQCVKQLGNLNISRAVYLGFFIHAAEAHAATDRDIILTDIFNNSATVSIPASDSDHATFFEYVELLLSDFTGVDTRYLKSIAIVSGATMSVDEVFNIDEIVAYKISNGKGPALGNLKKVILGSATMVRGSIVEYSYTTVTDTVVKGAADGVDVAGILCTSGGIGDIGYIQTTGKAMMECGTATAVTEGEGVAAATINTFKLGDAAEVTSFARYLGKPGNAPLAAYSLGWIGLGFSGPGTP